MKINDIIKVFSLLCLVQFGYAQLPTIEVVGTVRLTPIKLFNEGAQTGMILFEGGKGVFRGYNGYKWVNLSINAHADINNCPNPSGDVEVPKPRCLTSLSVSLANDGTSVIFAEDYDLGTTDNCGYYSTSFSPTDSVPSLSLTCADLGVHPINVYFKDTAGNANYCDVLVVVQDNTSYCVP